MDGQTERKDVYTSKDHKGEFQILRIHQSTYNHERLKLDDSRFMKQNADFQEGISQA